MPKISKNIKKFRAEKQLTQDALAEKIHVTRQAISNWENDKTKPDIEALEALSEALGVEIEELIYGEKKEVIVSQDKTKEKNRIKIILSIIGSLFVASGIAIVFFGFWQNFVLPLQTAFSLIPMLLGQAVAIFTYLKKKDSIAWREGAAIIWTVGIVSTIALIDYIYDISWIYTDYLIIDSLLVLPVMFIFGAVAPLVFYFYMAIHISTVGNLQNVLLSMLLFAVGVIYTHLLSRNKEAFCGKFAQWLTSLASIPLFYVYTLTVFESGLVEASSILLIGGLASYFLCAFIATPQNSPFYLPYRPLSIAGLSISLTSLTFAIYTYKSVGIAEIICMLVLVAIPLVFGVIKREELLSNISKMLVSVISFVTLIFAFALAIADESDANYYTTALFTMAFGGVLVYYGIKELRLLVINLGLFIAFIQIISIFLHSGYYDIFVLGILLAVFGGVIIVINWKMLSIKKSLKEQLSGGGNND